MISGVLLALLGVTLVFWGVGAYQRLSKLRQAVAVAFALLAQELHQRHEVVLQFADAVAPWLSQDRRLIDRLTVTTQRAQRSVQVVRDTPAKATGVLALGKSERLLDAVLGALNAAADACADEAERQALLPLRQSLSDIDVRIEFARQLFNDAVVTYNEAIHAMPTRLLHRLLGFSVAARLSRYSARSRRGGLTP